MLGKIELAPPKAWLGEQQNENLKIVGQNKQQNNLSVYNSKSSRSRLASVKDRLLHKKSFVLSDRGAGAG